MREHKAKVDGAGLRMGVIVSRFNSAITDRLLAGALDAFRSHGVADEDVEIVRVPGAFEIPLLAKLLADRGQHDAIVCLGAVIRGETPHFEYISAAVVAGICRLSVEQGLPIALGILTTNSVEQALRRSQPDRGNKGYEAAVTAIEMANLRKLVA